MAVKKPMIYSPAEHQRTIRLKRLAVWQASGLFDRKLRFSGAVRSDDVDVNEIAGDQ